MGVEPMYPRPVCVLGFFCETRKKVPSQKAGDQPATVVVTRSLARRQRIERCFPVLETRVVTSTSTYEPQWRDSNPTFVRA